jgi:hypothetical protein
MRQLGRQHNADMPPLPTETYQRIAEMLRDPINRFVQSERAREAAGAIREGCAG